MADPTRVRILLLVGNLQLSVGELAEVLDQSQPRVSRHVRILAEAGLVRRQKEGAWVFVGLGDSALTDHALAMVRLAEGNDDPIAPERARLTQVRAERQRVIDGWFETNAREWDLLRRMGGPDDAVEQALVAAARSPSVGRLLDIGTGTGRVLELLADHAQSAIGIDRSPEMLRLARGKLASSGHQQAEVLQADMGSLPFADGSFDTVTIHHVLHFADDPAAVITEAARILAPGGQLLVADYGPHSHEELRGRFHHQRLGFEDDSVLGYMEDAALKARLLSRHPGPELGVTLWEGRR